MEGGKLAAGAEQPGQRLACVCMCVCIRLNIYIYIYIFCVSGLFCSGFSQRFGFANFHAF